MAYRKKITFSIWSPSSIENAIKELEQEKAKYDTKHDAFLSSLADKIKDYLDKMYEGKPVQVTATPDSNVIRVHAEGTGLLFIEFGTGLPADSSEGVRFNYGAGSWSREHAGTYDEWVSSGRPMEEYPYNMAGLDAFMGLEMDLRQLIKESFREVFRK